MKSTDNETMQIYSKVPSIGQSSGLYYLYIIEKEHLSSLDTKLIKKKHKDAHF